MKKLLFLFLIIATGLVVWWSYFRTTTVAINLTENKTATLSLNFIDLPPEISEINCWVLNYPIKSMAKISLKTSKLLKLENGIDNIINCDAKVNDQWWPLIWPLTIKNLDNGVVLTKPIKTKQSIININSLMLKASSRIILVSSDWLLSLSSSSPNVNNQFKLKQLKLQNIIPDEIPLPSNKTSPVANGQTIYMNSLNLPVEQNTASVLFASWYDYNFYNLCGAKFGITSEEIKNLTGLEFNHSKLGKFIWDPNYIDGWRNPNAISLKVWNNCSFDNSLIKWTCETDNNGLPIQILSKNQLCSESKNPLVKDQCEYDYFINKIYPQSENCIDRPLINLGGKSIKIDFPYPSAKGLSYVQRGLVLDDKTISIYRESNLIKPTFINKQLVPCQINVKFLGLLNIISNQQVMFYLQIQNTVNDLKSECQDAAENLDSVNSLFLGEKHETN